MFIAPLAGLRREDDDDDPGRSELSVGALVVVDLLNQRTRHGLLVYGVMKRRTRMCKSKRARVQRDAHAHTEADAPAHARTRTV